MESDSDLYKKLQKLSLKSDIHNRCIGSIVGAFIGDSIGSYLEFSKFEITKNEAKKALTMPGGGVFELSPGQITDDSELALCMMYGLIEGKKILEMDAIAKYFKIWYNSQPFDIGETTSNALKGLKEKNYNEKSDIQNKNINGLWMKCRQNAYE